MEKMVQRVRWGFGGIKILFENSEKDGIVGTNSYRNLTVNYPSSHGYFGHLMSVLLSVFSVTFCLFLIAVQPVLFGFEKVHGSPESGERK